MTYSVVYAESVYKTQVEPLSSAERDEVDTHIRNLANHPLPGKGAKGLFRVRDVSGPVQPLFAARTRHFMIFHTVERDSVVVLGVFSVSLEV